MLRTIWGDDDRYVQTYFSKWPGRPDLYFPGDGAKRDDDGCFWILGRVDDVLNVAGHRIGTMEVESALVDQKGKQLPMGGGLLTITEPWPAMLRTIWGDDARYQQTYWSKFPGQYFAGDGAKVDEDGYWWILGRVDDVLNVAGHRIGTMEVESALVDHPSVAEAAVVGKHHDLKGQALAAFVTLKEGSKASAELKDDLKDHVAKKIGAIARPDDILFSADLPKTRSGKIMRRLLKDIAEGRALGDTTTLADPSVVSRLKDMYEAEES